MIKTNNLKITGITPIIAPADLRQAAQSTVLPEPAGPTISVSGAVRDSTAAALVDGQWTEADLALIDEADALLGSPEAARPRRRRNAAPPGPRSWCCCW